MAGAPKKDPQLKKNPMALKLPQWLIEWLNEEGPPRSILIEKALCEKYKLTPPTSKVKKS